MGRLMTTWRTGLPFECRLIEAKIREDDLKLLILVLSQITA